ncbi:HpcH/HpaI aldolase/citrate lyase family protein [Nesterenkonia sp. E16_7]|uniref:HpcH/HpaI aldolase family protein n=1 Tax=unclassified Nesterenkonia TaxID=2629769 RepID=UPI001A93808F|nr:MULTISPECIES: HpcH/HpaI aldolase/citrate lyase family protein [unclassified Nesterenkonia]MBO0595868.1 HpcH/HpaI aldolase/citrate lyase family protein [Nesterenkonia sp. E16_10]MBO0599533.1 HpcH/HpaI aldolase/citrate lyase family protein [Nesterenkonia sp. E16_7]
MPLQLTPTLREELAAADRALIGGWVCSGSPVMAEIMAGSGLDLVLIDMEHAPNGLESVLAQLHALSGYPVTPLVRLSSDDPVSIKQVLDLGVQNLLIPMISTPEQARAVAAATQYPPAGRRGIGNALARSGRWNRVQNYLDDAAAHISVYLQIETMQGVENAEAIAAVEGIDGIFAGPSDLSASMGLLGQQTHPQVVEAVKATFGAAQRAGATAGVNAFDPAAARDYLDAGASWVLVGADVTLVARGSEQLAADFIPRTAH